MVRTENTEPVQGFRSATVVTLLWGVRHPETRPPVDGRWDRKLLCRTAPATSVSEGTSEDQTGHRPYSLIRTARPEEGPPSPLWWCHGSRAQRPGRRGCPRPPKTNDAGGLGVVGVTVRLHGPPGPAPLETLLEKGLRPTHTVTETVGGLN